MTAVLTAGLPNINGQFRLAGTTRSTTYAEGAFEITYSGGNYEGGHEGGGTNPNVSFMASRSNSIYGNSNTVQPPSIVLIPQIKF